VGRGQHYACRLPACRLPVRPKKMLAGLGSRLGQRDGSYFWIMPGPTPREHDKSNQRGTQDERVDQEPQDDRVRADLHAAHNGEAHRGAEEDAVATDVRTDRDGPERELVPRQEKAGKGSGKARGSDPAPESAGMPAAGTFPAAQRSRPAGRARRRPPDVELEAPVVPTRTGLAEAPSRCAWVPSQRAGPT
jgi:hypothetical protein